MNKLLMLFPFVFALNFLNAQISPTSSPYYEWGEYTVKSDSDMTSLDKPLLFFYPETPGTYPVFMFQLGANGFGSSVINRHTYDLFMEHLASYGFVVIVIDDSQAGFPTGTTFKAAHDWYKEKCSEQGHWLNAYADVNKFVVGGHSNGGVNASAILVDRPDEIQGIIFMDSYPSPGTLGIGVHDVSGYTGKEMTMAADENTPETYKGGYEQFTSSACKTFVNIEGLDHGGFGDYILESQPVGPIGREDATGTIRHFLVSWFLSEFKNDAGAGEQLMNETNHPNTVKEFLNDCGTVNIEMVQESNLNIYPNPAISSINIEAEQENNEVKIYNASGQLVYTENFKISSKINITDFSAGLYMISVYNKESGNITNKNFIKN